MNNKLIINLIPGDTFIHKLTGTTKVRIFAVLMFYLIMTWDIRMILPVLVLAVISLISLKPSWNSIKYIIFIVFTMNIFTLFLFYLADPDYGALWTNGGSTIFHQFNSYFILTYESMFYFIVRYLKMITSFFVSLVFILSITPSEMAAGLNSIGVPYKICTVVSIAFRYIPDIARDYNNISISMQARGVERDGRKISAVKRLKQMIMILLPLIITSFERVGNIANAMDLRSYGKGKKRSYFSEHPSSKFDKVIQMITFILFAFCLYYSISRLISVPDMKMWYPF